MEGKRAPGKSGYGDDGERNEERKKYVVFDPLTFFTFTFSTCTGLCCYPSHPCFLNNSNKPN